MTDTTNETEFDASGLPVDPAARAAELDRLIAVGEGEMRQDIRGWQSDKERRGDHLILLEAREAMTNGSSGGSTDVGELESLHSQVLQAIADNELLMKHSIRAWQDSSNRAERDAHRKLLEISDRLSERTKAHR